MAGIRENDRCFPTMIAVTGIESLGGVRVLSGVLIDPIAEADFRGDVFSAFLISTDVREIVCEKLVFVSGVGTTGDGQFVRECESRLVGGFSFLERSSTEKVLTEVAENRIRLIVVGELRGCKLPAFVSERRSVSVKSIQVLVELNVSQASGLPDSLLFAAQNPEFSGMTKCVHPIEGGLTLPVNSLSGDSSFVGALQIIRRRCNAVFDARIWHSGSPIQVAVGNELERWVRGRVDNSSQNREFRGVLGTIVGMGAEKEG